MMLLFLIVLAAAGLPLQNRAAAAAHPVHHAAMMHGTECGGPMAAAYPVMRASPPPCHHSPLHAALCDSGACCAISAIPAVPSAGFAVPVRRIDFSARAPHPWRIVRPAPEPFPPRQFRFPPV